MKKLFLFLALIFISSSFVQANSKFDTLKELFPFSHKITEVSYNFGFANGNIANENLDNYNGNPLFVQVAYDLNKFLNWNKVGNWQFALEPHFNTITDPSNGFEIGMGFFLKYNFPLNDKITTFAELGVSPMYITIDTIEQGQKGFNFLDQAGIGMKYHLNDTSSINLGLRLRHMSHGNLRNSSNSGIDTKSVYIGFSKAF